MPYIKKINTNQDNLEKHENTNQDNLENREEINEKKELQRLNIFSRFVQRNKTKFTVILDSTPIGALTVPYETIRSKTLDGEEISGVNRVIYTLLSVTKIGSAALFLSPLISQMFDGDVDGLNETIKGTTGFVTGTIWQAVYLGHRYAMNPEIINDYLETKPRLRKMSLWFADNLNKFSFAKDIISKNIDNLDMQEIESVLIQDNNTKMKNA